MILFSYVMVHVVGHTIRVHGKLYYVYAHTSTIVSVVWAYPILACCTRAFELVF